MVPSPISNLVDLSTIHYNNLNLIAKKAVEYVERMKTANCEINGLSYSSIPANTKTRVRISLKSSVSGTICTFFAESIREAIVPEIYFEVRLH